MISPDSLRSGILLLDGEALSRLLAKELLHTRQVSDSCHPHLRALWKDADPDLPILKEAKADYAKLQ